MRYVKAEAGDVRGVSQSDPLSTLAFWEHKDGEFRREVFWTILAPRLRGTVTQVLVREGDPNSGGAVLYTLPIENGRSDIQPPGYTGEIIIDQITSGSVEAVGDGPPGAWYQGTVPIEDLLQRLYRGPAYLEVRTDSVPTGEFRAPLGTPRFFLPPDDPVRWQPVYCS